MLVKLATICLFVSAFLALSWVNLRVGADTGVRMKGVSHDGLKRVTGVASIALFVIGAIGVAVAR